MIFSLSFDTTVVVAQDTYALVSSMEDSHEAVWLYSTSHSGVFLLSKRVLGPDEREALNLSFVVSSGQLQSGIVLNIP